MARRASTRRGRTSWSRTGSPARSTSIAVAVENRGGISSVLRKARERGIKVLTWDADAEPDARDFFVNQATSEGIANTLTDEAARLLGGKGEFAIVTGALSAANQNEWISFIKKRQAEKYPNLKLATIRPSDDDRDKAFAETQTIMRVFPDGQAGDGDFGAGRARLGGSRPSGGPHDVNVIGLSLPNMNKPYVHDGWVQTVVLWNTRDLGYLTVLRGDRSLTQNKISRRHDVVRGRAARARFRSAAARSSSARRCMFTKANIDRFDF